MSLTDLLVEIKKVEPFTTEDVENGPYETLNARRGRKNQAIEEYVRLKRRYTNELMRTAAYVVVIGSKRDEFVASALNGAKFLTADPEEYFANLVNLIPPALYLGRESLSNVFEVVRQNIERVAPSLGINEFPQLIFRQEYQRTFHSKEEFQSLIKQAIVNQLGGEIVGIQAANSLTESAIARKIDKDATPVLLPAADERFAYRVVEDLKRISTRVFLIKAGEIAHQPSRVTVDVTLEEVTKEEVKKAINFIRSSLRK